MRLGLYRLITTLAMPFIAYSGWKRCHKYQTVQKSQPENPDIPNCFKSRFGFNPSHFQKNGIWIHAVSVGETRSIFQLITALKKRYPDTPITVTNGSTQGAIQTLLFAPESVQHQMIPFDYPFAVKRFLNQLQPKLVMMVETEIWPNLYQACSKQNIPIILANARMKERSFYDYQRWGGKMITDALNQTQFIAAQFPIDADRFKALGVEPNKIKVLGNLKFDVQPAPDLLNHANKWKKDNHLNDRFIWVAASTHADPNGQQSEEALILEAHQRLLKVNKRALLILTPRHASRFKEVANLLKNSHLNWARRSLNQPISKETQVYLADSIGELMNWFAACDIAFIGGSLVPFGGHNILEPACLGKPVLSGTHYQNLNALYDTFITQDAITLCETQHILAQQLIKLSIDTRTRKQKGLHAKACFEQNSGSLQKLLNEIQPYLTTSNTQ